MLIGLTLLVLIIPSLGSSGFFMKLFTDSGLEISCPSGNPIYINPISADLQQCQQRLGVYNESACPGGTMCERFPILIPEFQDYCCWANKTPTEEEITSEKPISPEDIPPFSRRGTPDRGVVKGIVERPKTVVSGEDENEDEDEDISRRSGTRRSSKSPSFPDEEDEDEWEDGSTRRTRRPRGRKVTSVTTPEPEVTTKKPSSSHRLPQCNNPDESVFIDFGNRLRDCYFQQCGRGYRCEFNKYMRRFICCGKDSGMVPPPGLPRIPAPKPLNPRPLRPPQRPFGVLSDGSDGSDNADGLRYRPRSSCCEENDCPPGDDGGRQWERGCQNRNTRCPNDELGSENCRNNNRGSNFGETIPREPPMQPNNRETNVDFPRNGCDLKQENGNGCPFAQNRVEMGERNMEEDPGWMGSVGSSHGVMIPEPRPFQNVFPSGPNNLGPMPDFEPRRPEEHRRLELVPLGPPMQPKIRENNVNFPGNGCGMNQENENGCPFVQNRVEMGEMGRINMGIPEPRPLQNIGTQGQSSFGPTPDFVPRQLEKPGRVEFPPPEFRPLSPRVEQLPGDRERFVSAPSPRHGYIPEDVQPSRRSLLPPFHRLSKGNAKNLQDDRAGVEGEVCVVGTEYTVEGIVPSCNSANSDFCPSSHPHCSHSSSLKSQVCCSQLARLSRS